MKISKKIRRFIPILFIIMATSAISAVYFAGSMLSAPALRTIGPPPPDLNAREVTFDGVRGWFVPTQEGNPCVLLMHGVRSDRRSMINRARFLREEGYSSLLFDFQAHGESPGQHITFGHLESANANAAITLLRSQFKCPKIAAIGQSLGGAAALLGEGPIQADMLVLESVYPTIEEAVTNRLKIRFGDLGSLFTPLLTMQLKPRLGIDSHALEPARRISDYHNPILVMAGTADQHTPLDEARLLYRAANEPKAFWAVSGAGHVDLQKYAPQAYRKRVLAFLTRYL